MESSYFFSIIIPCYNAERYIDQCVDGIKRQTYKNFEVVFVDDNSTDATYEKCIKYAKQNKNFSVCTYPDGKTGSNRGQAVARNLGIENAKGSWILFLDVDDCLREDSLEVISSKCEGVDLVFFDFSMVFKNYSKNAVFDIDEKKYSTCDFLKLLGEKISWQSLACIGNKVYKKAIIDKNQVLFDSKYSYYEDIAFCLNYLQNAPKIAYVKEVLYFYYQLSGSFSNKYRKNISECSDQILIMLEKVAEVNGCKEQLVSYVNKMRLYFLYYSIRNEIFGKGIVAAVKYSANLLMSEDSQRALEYNSKCDLSIGEKTLNGLMLHKHYIIITLVIYLRMVINSIKEEKN